MITRNPKDNKIPHDSSQNSKQLRRKPAKKTFNVQVKKPSESDIQAADSWFPQRESKYNKKQSRQLQLAYVLTLGNNSLLKSRDQIYNSSLQLRVTEDESKVKYLHLHRKQKQSIDRILLSCLKQSQQRVIGRQILINVRLPLLTQRILEMKCMVLSKLKLVGHFEFVRPYLFTLAFLLHQFEKKQTERNVLYCFQRIKSLLLVQ